GGHVDTVHVRVAHGRRRGCEVHASRTGLTREIDDLRGRRAAHDRVVDQQDVLAAELEVDDVELRAHRLRALLLPRHDERPPDVAIFHETFAVLDAKNLRHLHRRRAARVWNWNDDVDVVIRPNAAN